MFGNNGVSFRLFPGFRAEKPGGFPSPESGTGCQGSSTALSLQPPRGQTGGIEHRALPRAAPVGRIRSGHGALRPGPSDTPVSSTGQALVELRPQHFPRSQVRWPGSSVSSPATASELGAWPVAELKRRQALRSQRHQEGNHIKGAGQIRKRYILATLEKEDTCKRN